MIAEAQFVPRLPGYSNFFGSIGFPLISSYAAL